MASTPPPGDTPATAPPSSRARREAARHRIGTITRATAVAAAMTTGVVAVLAATNPHSQATAGTGAAVTNQGTQGTLAPATDTPTITSQPPVASSGGS